MILAVDIGNSKIAFGFLDTKTLAVVAKLRLAAAPARTADEYELLISAFTERRGICSDAVEGCALSSVVPGLTDAVVTAVRRLFGCRILTVSHGVRTGLDIRTNNHVELGADIVANMVAASARLTPPFAVLDLGTATTVSAVNRKGEFIGVMICPGIIPSLNSMSESCAALPVVKLYAPKELLCKNTEDAMASGAIYAPAAMLDGIVARLKGELGGELSLVACGGMAEKIIPHMAEPPAIVPELTFEGLGRIYRLNQRKKG